MLAVLLAAVAAAPQVQLHVDATCQLWIGDQGQIPATLFGITAFEGFPAVVANADYRARLVAIQPGAVRFPASLGWYGPPSPAEAEEWFDGPRAGAILEQSLLFGARYPLGRFLRVARRMAMEPIAQLASVPQWMERDAVGIPKDFDAWARMAAGLVAALRRFDPNLRYVEVWNEPNASWFRAADRFRAHPGGFVGAHVELFNKTADAVKAKAPGVLVGGPVLCWPPAWPPAQKGHKPWYTWRQWTLPFLKGTRGRCDFFDFHAYGISGPQAAVQLELIAAASEQILGRRLPVLITESNFPLSPKQLGGAAEWQERVLPYEDFLWGLLGQTDKVAANLVHDLHAGRWAVLPSADRPRPLYWLLWIFRDLRGWRAAAGSSAADVRVAAACRRDAVNVVCFNSSDSSRDVALEVKLAGYWTGPYIRALVPEPGGALRPGTLDAHAQRRPGRAIVRFTLPPKATAAVVLRSAGFLRPRRHLRLREFFSGICMQALRVGHPVAATVAVPEHASRASVRISLLGATADTRLTVSINGQSTRLTGPPPIIELPAPAAGRLRVSIEPETGPSNLTVAFISAVATVDGAPAR